MELTNAEKLIKMIEVVFSNVLTWLVALQAVVTWLLASGAFDSFPQVINYLMVAATVLTVAITFIRRVTPVQEGSRGLLSKPGTKPTDWV